MWQHNGTPNDLIGLLSVNAQPHVDFHGLVELRWFVRFQDFNRLRQRHRLFRSLFVGF